MKKNKIQQLQLLLSQIPYGKITTYREIAHAMGTKGYRSIGQLLNKNPEPDQYPCYKVVQSDGKLGGFAKGIDDKIRRLEADGIEIKNGKIIDFKEKIYKFQNRDS